MILVAMMIFKIILKSLVEELEKNKFLKNTVTSFSNELNDLKNKNEILEK